MAADGCGTEESLFSSGKRPMLQQRALHACVCVGGTQWIQWVINNKKKNKKLRAGRGSEKSRGKLGSIYNQNTSYTCMDLSKKKHVFVFRDLQLRALQLRAPAARSEDPGSVPRAPIRQLTTF